MTRSVVEEEKSREDGRGYSYIGGNLSRDCRGG
jgi:hypothetical protein